MKLQMAAFKGEIPAMSERLLTPEYATLAENVRLENGELIPYADAKDIQTFDDPVKTILFHEDEWLSWEEHVNAVPGPVASERLYVTGDGVPKMIIDGVTYPLALNAPTSAPTITVTGTPDIELAESTLFAYTFVTEFGEESQPSPASAAVDIDESVTISIASLETPPTDRGIDKVRIYRTTTSATGVTDFYFLVELDAGTASYSYDPSVTEIAEAITVTDFTPPVDDLEGLIALPNGMMAAFSGKELYFCEPYQPHAWPSVYSLSTDFKIVGLAAYGSSVAILTEGTPYVAQGSTPLGMVMERLEQNYPCIAAEGIVDIGYAAIYPSTEGLVVLSSSQATLISESFFTRRQWDELNPTSFIANRDGQKYYASYLPEGETERKVMIFDMDGSQPFVSRINLNVEAMSYQLETGDLYIVIDGTELKQWDSLDESLLKYTWHSKVFVLDMLTNFGCIMIDGYELDSDDDPTMTAKVYADGALVSTITKLNEPARLKGGFLARRWHVEITGSLAIEAITIASEISDFTQ